MLPNWINLPSELMPTLVEFASGFSRSLFDANGKDFETLLALRLLAVQDEARIHISRLCDATAAIYESICHKRIAHSLRIKYVLLEAIKYKTKRKALC